MREELLKLAKPFRMEEDNKVNSLLSLPNPTFPTFRCLVDTFEAAFTGLVGPTGEREDRSGALLPLPVTTQADHDHQEHSHFYLLPKRRQQT